MADNGNMLTMDIKINSSLPSPLREEKSFSQRAFLFIQIFANYKIKLKLHIL